MFPSSLSLYPSLISSCLPSNLSFSFSLLFYVASLNFKLFAPMPVMSLPVLLVLCLVSSSYAHFSVGGHDEAIHPDNPDQREKPLKHTYANSLPPYRHLRFSPLFATIYRNRM